MPDYVIKDQCMASVADKLELLREEMRKNEIDIYIVPSIDAHNSEYVPECWERRAWISDFDGSAGEVMVTLEHAYLSTDGRYFLQATNQLDSQHYSLIKQKGFVSEIDQWLLKNTRDKMVAIDPDLSSIDRANKLSELVQQGLGMFTLTEYNLIDACRKSLGEKIELPKGTAFAQPEIYSGQSTASKLNFIRQELAKQRVDFIALNVLDEIAWVFNMRGNDIEYNPLVISYAIIGKHKAWIFVDTAKVLPDLQAALTASGVDLVDYEMFEEHLSDLEGAVWFDEKTANYAMYDKVTMGTEIILHPSPIVLAKACKNSVEINGTRNAHIKDAAAVISFLHWLDNNWHSGVTEISCAAKLAQFRTQQDLLKGMSFNTISGFAGNGAIVHYRVEPETNKTIDDSSLYLIDSGGQYMDGTTDITRTVHLGVPTPEQKRHYTLVLKGHLALGRAVFPHGTCGEHLDGLARGYLWREYLNYGHGTGHGVGSFLCVHEGPQKISSAISNVPLLPGMIVSNEPGLYITGQYGIRIENLCLINQDLSPKAVNSEYGPFYYFEDLTLVPYARKLIDIGLLDDVEKRQIKAYYQKIADLVKDKLTGEAKQWLDDELSLFN